MPHCQAEHTSPHATLLGTANLALCPNVRRNKPRPTPHSQTLQTSHHAPLSDTANFAPRSILRHFKLRTTSHCQTQQTSPCAALSVMMPEFIRRMRYSGTAWQVCHASHYLVFLMQFGLRWAAAFESSPIHLLYPMHITSTYREHKIQGQEKMKSCKYTPVYSLSFHINWSCAF